MTKSGRFIIVSILTVLLFSSYSAIADSKAWEIADTLRKSFVPENLARTAWKMHDFLKNGYPDAAKAFLGAAESFEGDFQAPRETPGDGEDGLGVFLPVPGNERDDSPSSPNAVFNAVMGRARAVSPGFEGTVDGVDLYGAFERMCVTHYRGETIPRMFSVEPFDPWDAMKPSSPKKSIEPFNPAWFSLAKGFPDRVKAVKTGGPHTFADLTKYVHDRFPEAIARDIAMGNRKIEFHFFPAEVSFEFLKGRGYTKFWKIGTVSGLSHRGLYLAARADGSDPIYVANHIFGYERLLHVMLTLKLAAPSDRVIPPDSVHLWTCRGYDSGRTEALYTESLADIEVLPPTVIINYQNSILRDLLNRKRAREIYSAWISDYGRPPLTALASRARAEGFGILARVFEMAARRIKGLSPSELFNSGPASAEIRRVHALLKACSTRLNHPFLASTAAVPASAARWFDPDLRVGRTVSDGVLNRSYFSYAGPDGMRVDAVVFRCVWGGDCIEALGKVLASKMKAPTGMAAVSKGTVKITKSDASAPMPGFPGWTVLHLGTAGSAVASHGAGSVHVPSAIYDWDLTRVDRKLHNVLLDVSERRADSRCGEGPGRVLTGASLLRVWSPLVEDMDFLAMMHRRKFTTVEVEVAALHRFFEGFARKNPHISLRLGAMMMITDLLGSDITLEQHGAANVALETAAFTTGFDMVAEYLGMTDLLE